MAYDVKPAVTLLLSYLEDLQQETLVAAISSYLKRFSIQLPHDDDEADQVVLICNYPKTGHERKKLPHREYIDVVLEDMNYAQLDSAESALNLRTTAAEIFVRLIRERFSIYFNENDDVYSLLTWLQPQYWENDPSNGKDAITKLCQHFQIPLTAAGFDIHKVFIEWKSLQVIVKSCPRRCCVGKIIPLQKKEIPKYSNACRARDLFIVIKQCSRTCL